MIRWHFRSLKREFSKRNYVQLRVIIDDTELCCSVDGENLCQCSDTQSDTVQTSGSKWGKLSCIIFRLYVNIAKQLSDLDGKVSILRHLFDTTCLKFYNILTVVVLKIQKL